MFSQLSNFSQTLFSLNISERNPIWVEMSFAIVPKVAVIAATLG
jgi:hypothetical protein